MAHSGRGRAGAAPTPVLQELSLRERQILGMLGEGRSFKTMAMDLGISLNTIHTHAKRIRAKYHLAGNAELHAFAIRGYDAGAIQVPVTNLGTIQDSPSAAY